MFMTLIGKIIVEWIFHSNWQKIFNYRNLLMRKMERFLSFNKSSIHLNVIFF